MDEHDNSEKKNRTDDILRLDVWIIQKQSAGAPFTIIV